MNSGSDLEEKLRLSEQRFQVALKNSPIMLIELNCDLRFKWIYNPLVDLAPEEFIGKKLDETGAVKDITPLKNFYLEIFRSGLPRRAEIRLEHTGRVAYYDVYAEPLKNEKGEIAGLTSALTDITEHKKAEEELKESEQRYRTLVETSTDAIIVHKQGRFLFVNQATLKLFGASSFDELKDKNIFDFTPLEERENMQRRLASVQAGGKAVPQEEQVIRLNGTRVFVEAIGAPIYYKGDWAILAILRDITSRKALQQNLEEYTRNLEKTLDEHARKILENEQSYRELYESFDEAFIATDWELNVIHWNKAAERVTRAAAKDALGKKIYDVLPEMLTVDVTSYFETLKEKKPARFMMNTISRETGKDAIFEISTYPSTLGIIAIVEDKTEEEQTKRLLAIGQTAGMVGHDIRNPLQAITSDLYLLKSELENTPEGECKRAMLESIESIDENVVYINKIVSDLQDYTRPLHPNINPVILKDLISNALIVANIPERIQTQVTVEGNLTLETDATYIMRIITNLITNAVQAMPKNGRLTVSASRKEDKAVISIEDTGVGIPEEIKLKMFKPLFTTKAKGQGLGLAVVKRLVEALRGTINFESQEGKGTKFIVTLPAT